MLLSREVLFAPPDRHRSSGRTLSELEDSFQGLWLCLHAQPNFLTPASGCVMLQETCDLQDPCSGDQKPEIGPRW